MVHVQGLQAGTPYDIRLTGSNQFGSITKEVSTTPLIGAIMDFVQRTLMGRASVVCWLVVHSESL